MQVVVSHILKKSRGGTARREQDIEAATIRIGRGADCELYLADPRMALGHAVLEARPGGVFIDALGGADLSVNGASTSTAKLVPGDKVALGPYEVEVLPGKDGKDIAFSVELVRPLGDDLAELKLRSNVRLTRVGLGKRAWSYGLVAVILAVFLALPLTAFFGRGEIGKSAMMKGQSSVMLAAADQLWLPGAISNSHKFFGDSCQSCHQQAFVQVKDGACLTCHEKVTHHADPVKFPTASFAGEACASCHKEHNGPKALVRQDQEFCSSCHSGIAARAPGTTLGNASDFGKAHPQFRVTVVTDAVKGTVQRLSLADKPAEQSGLKFPHEKHLNPKGMRSPQVPEAVVLTCSNCHQPDSGGVLMQTAKFDTSCSGCHLLQFEPQALDRRMPHGKPAEAMQYVRDTYDSIALRGGFAETSAPEAVRRVPGQAAALTETERLSALAWANKKADEVIVGRYGKGLCAHCHVVQDSADPLTWTLAEVRINQRWLPGGAFTHAKHRDADCTGCHAATTSAASSDVLIPGVETCQNCHGGEKAADKVSSTCVSCHGFHKEGLPKLRTPGKSAALPADHGAVAANWTGPAAR